MLKKWENPYLFPQRVFFSDEDSPTTPILFQQKGGIRYTVHKPSLSINMTTARTPSIEGRKLNIPDLIFWSGGKRHTHKWKDTSSSSISSRASAIWSNSPSSEEDSESTSSSSEYCCKDVQGGKQEHSVERIKKKTMKEDPNEKCYTEQIFLRI